MVFNSLFSVYVCFPQIIFLEHFNIKDVFWNDKLLFPQNILLSERTAWFIS